VIGSAPFVDLQIQDATISQRYKADYEALEHGLSGRYVDADLPNLYPNSKIRPIEPYLLFGEGCTMTKPGWKTASRLPEMHGGAVYGFQNT
jgi:hypothetical protein